MKDVLRLWLYRLAGLLPQRGRTRFIVVANPRCGTNWLRSLLNSHRRALMLGELFNPAYTVPDPVLLACPSGYLRWNMVKPYRKRPRAIGFKLLSGHLHPGVEVFEEFLAQLGRDPELRVVHLVREDRLAQVVSFVRASREQNWRNRGYATRHLELSPEECSRLLEQALRSDERFADLFRRNPVFRMTYEQLPDQVGDLLQFLGLPPGALRSRLERQSSQSPRQVLTNYEELKERFAGTEYAVYF